MTEFIRKCIGDAVPTVTIKTYPNQKPWIDGSIRAPHLIMERWLGIWRNTNSVIIPSARQSNRQNISIETNWSHNSRAQTWDVSGRVDRQSRTTKVKPATSCFRTSYTFIAHFEDNTVPPTWPATKDCGLSFLTKSHILILKYNCDFILKMLT